MYPEFATRRDLSRPAHPGTVTFVGPDGAERVESIDYLQNWLTFAPDETGTIIPVVRVVCDRDDRGYNLCSFAADGRLLCVRTVAAPKHPTAFTATRRDAGRYSRRRPVPTRAVAAEPTGWF